MSPKEEMLQRMREDAEANGYFLTPDRELLDDLIAGLVKNEGSLGYASCPCRLASGVKGYDADIICPCEYRDADANEYGSCYCCLFVTKELADDPSKLKPIPERRPVEAQDAAFEARERLESGESVETPEAGGEPVGELKGKYPVWRCTVCGYLAAREAPPPICPICKAKADRFERFA